jgi:hypothetical protein
MSDLELVYLGKPLGISSGTCDTINTYNLYQNKAEEAARQFKVALAAYGNIEKFVNKGLDYGRELIESYVEATANDLVRKGYYTINKERIIGEHGEDIYYALPVRQF